MANEFYDHGSFPSNGAAGSSAAMRSELELIEAGFAKLPTMANKGKQLVAVNSGGTALEAVTTIDGSALTSFRVSSTGGLGYGGATGTGGTVTQATSKSTAVALAKVCGEITMNNAALAAATIVSFDCTNAIAAAGDVVIVNHVSGGTLGSYTVDGVSSAGKITFYVRNNTAGSLSEAIVLRYAIVKATTA